MREYLTETSLTEPCARWDLFPAGGLVRSGPRVLGTGCGVGLTAAFSCPAGRHLRLGCSLCNKVGEVFHCNRPAVLLRGRFETLSRQPMQAIHHRSAVKTPLRLHPRSFGHFKYDRWRSRCSLFCGGTHTGFMPPESLVFRGSSLEVLMILEISISRETRGLPMGGIRMLPVLKLARNSASSLSRRAVSSADRKEGPLVGSGMSWPSAGDGPRSFSGGVKSLWPWVLPQYFTYWRTRNLSALAAVALRNFRATAAAGRRFGRPWSCRRS